MTRLLPTGLILASLVTACTAGAPAPPAVTPAPAAAPTAPPASPGAPTVAPTAAPSPQAAAAPAPTVRGAATRMVTVRFGTGAVLINNAGVLIAQEKGWFAEQGINLEVVEFASGPELAAPLASNQLDVGLLGINSGLLNAFSRGVRVKFAADAGSTAPGPYDYVAIAVRKDLVDSGRVKTPADFKGLKVALVGKGTPSDYGLLHLLKEGGLTLDDVTIELLPFSSMPAAFAASQIDAAFLIDPFLSQAIDTGSAVVFRTGEQFIPGAQLAVIAFSEVFARNTDAATRFMVAYLKGLRMYNDAIVKNDPAAAAEVRSIFLKHIRGLTDERYQRIKMVGLNPNGAINTQSLRDQQAFYLQVGTQEREVNLDELVDLQFVESAVRILGPYR